MSRSFACLLLVASLGACARDPAAANPLMLCPVGRVVACPCSGHDTKYVSLIVAPAGTVEPGAPVSGAVDGVVVGRATASSAGAFALAVASFDDLRGSVVQITSRGQTLAAVLPRDPAQTYLAFGPGDGLDDSAGDIRLTANLRPLGTTQPLSRVWLVNASTADITTVFDLRVGDHVDARVRGQDGDLVALVLRHTDGAADGCTLGAGFGLMQCGCSPEDVEAARCVFSPEPAGGVSSMYAPMDPGPSPTDAGAPAVDAGPPDAPATPADGGTDAEVDFGTVT